MSNYDIDDYLSALLAYSPAGSRKRGPGGDSVCLIHVPGEGPETVYSLGLSGEQPMFTAAFFQQVVWELLPDETGFASAGQPEVEVLKAVVEASHPVLAFLDEGALRSCRSQSDGCPGMEYYMLIWQLGDERQAVECWEPELRQDQDWLKLIGAFQALSSQFEYAVAKEAFANA